MAQSLEIGYTQPVDVCSENESFKVPIHMRLGVSLDFEPGYLTRGIGENGQSQGPRSPVLRESVPRRH